MPKKTEIQIGGQALVEGVMMKAKDKYALATRDPDGKIHTKEFKHKSILKRLKINKIPFVRGIFILIETMYIGTKTIIYSADRNFALTERLEEDKKNKKKSKKNTPIQKKEKVFGVWEILTTLAISLGFALILFKLMPILGAKYLTNLFVKENTKQGNILFNILDGFLRIAIFLVYIVIISKLKDVKRLFQYHGAEHKTVNAYEQGKKLTVKNVKACSRIHPRCGTTFIFVVLVVSIFVFIFIPKDYTIWTKLGLRILLLPLVAGISYEFIKFASKFHNNKIIDTITKPGLALQYITTNEPDDKQIEVGIKSLEKAIKN